MLISGATVRIKFQSTLPYGSDIVLSNGQYAVFIFQSTLPYGSDKSKEAELYDANNFNPRSLTGAT